MITDWLPSPPFRPFSGPAYPEGSLDKQIDSILSPPASGSGGGVITHPFKITDAKSLTGAVVKCQFGTVNSVDITLEDGTTALNTNPDVPLASPGTWSIFIALAVVDDETIATPDDDYCWVVAANSGLPDDTDIIGYILLAEVDVADVAGVNKVTAIRQAVTHSLRHSICGRVAETEDDDFAPGIHEFWGV